MAKALKIISRYKLKADTLSAIAGALALRSAMVFSLIIAARGLGPERFGELAALNNSAQLFQGLFGLGLVATGTVLLSRYRIENAVRASQVLSVILVSTVALVFLVAVAAWLSGHYLANVVYRTPTAAELFNLLAILAALFLLADFNGAILAGLGRFELRGVVEVCLAPTLPIAVWIGSGCAGVFGAATGLVIAYALLNTGYLVGVLHATGRLEVKWIWPSDRSVWHEIARFAFPAFLAGLCAMPAIWAGNVLLARTDEGLVELALFAAAFQWFRVLSYLPAVAISVSLAKLSSSLAAADRALAVVPHTRILILQYQKLLLTPTLLVCLASPIIVGMYGAGFEDAWLPLCLLAVAAQLESAVQLVANALAIQGRMWLRVLPNLVWAVTLVCLAPWLVTHGATGLATAHIIAQIARLTISFGLLSHNPKQADKS